MHQMQLLDAHKGMVSFCCAKAEETLQANGARADLIAAQLRPSEVANNSTTKQAK